MTKNELIEYIAYKLGFCLFDDLPRTRQEELLKQYGSLLSEEHLKEIKQRMKPQTINEE